MSNNSSSSKSFIYIGAFTIAIVLLGLFAFLLTRGSNDNNSNNSAVNGGGVSNNAQHQQINNPSVLETRGSFENTVDANLKIPGREINFTDNIDAITEYEATMEDTLDNPSTAQGTDGYRYVTFQSNPDKPISLYNIPFASDNPGLSYVFHNDSFEEVRFQFGYIDEASTNAIVTGFTNDYGESTFYRAMEGSKTWWWKSDSIWLMISQDSAGTSVFYRKL